MKIDKDVIEYNDWLLGPGEYILKANGSVEICQLPGVFSFTVAQQITSRALFTVHFAGLFLTFVTYCIFPSLRNQAGMSIMTVVMALMILHILTQYVNDFVQEIPKLCVTVAVLAHYSALVAFLWMTLIAWDIVQTFSMTTRLGRHPSNKWRRYLWNAILGFTIPALIILPCLIIHLCNCTDLPLSYGWNGSSCWINDGWVSLVVFGVPMSLCLSLNAVFFCWTVIGIRRSREAAKMATRDTTGRNSRIEEKFQTMMIYTKVF